MSDQLSLLAPEVMIGLTRPSHHHRRPILGQALSAASEIASGERKAREQESAVLAFYRANPGAWGPSQVYRRMGCRWPITSVRRAITNLTTSGHLRITMSRSMGMFGRMEHLWTLREGNK